MDTINNRVKNIRERFGFNQTEFSAKLDLKQSHLSFIESGKKEVTTKMISRLVERFNVSADWLFTGKGPEMVVYSEGSNKRQDTSVVLEDIKEATAEVNGVLAKLSNKYAGGEEMAK